MGKSGKKSVKAEMSEKRKKFEIIGKAEKSGFFPLCPGLVFYYTINQDFDLIDLQIFFPRAFGHPSQKFIQI